MSVGDAISIDCGLYGKTDGCMFNMSSSLVRGEFGIQDFSGNTFLPKPGGGPAETGL